MEAIYLQFVVDMSALRTAYDKAAGDVTKRNKLAADIKNLRHKALMGNIDLYSLERDTYKAVYKSEPTAAWQKASNLNVQEALLLKKLLDIRSRHEHAASADKPKLHNEAQAIRMKLVALGLDAYQVEERSWTLYFGKAMNADQRKTQYAFIDKAKKDYASMTEAKKKELAVVPIESYEKKKPTLSKLDLGNRYNETYSGADMVIFMAFPGYKPIEIGTASTVSYSTYREKKQIRTVGRVSSKGITKGPRTISGRIIFTVVREHVVETIKKEVPYLRDIKTLLMDELPAFDLLVSFGNEYGGSAGLVIQGITVVDEQKTLSIEDLFTENIFTYLARALEPMRDLNSTNPDRPYDPLSWFTSSFRPSGSEVLGNFKPKTLQLYTDSKLLAAPLPFYGTPSGWDSSKYNLNMNIPQLGNPGGASGLINGGGSGSEQFPPGPVEASGRADIFIQAVVHLGQQWAPVTGKVSLTSNGKKIGEKEIKVYTKKQMGKVTTYVSKPNSGSTQKFPIEYHGEDVIGAWFLDVPVKQSTELSVVRWDDKNTYEKVTHKDKVGFAEGNIVLIVKTSVNSLSPSEPSATKPMSFTYKDMRNTSKDWTIHYTSSNPKKENYDSNALSKKFAFEATRMKVSKKLPGQIAVSLRAAGDTPLNDWLVVWTWKLNLNYATRLSKKEKAKYDAINLTLGLTIEGAYGAWNAQEKQSAVPYWNVNTGSGISDIKPNDFFWTVSDKATTGKDKGKRKMLKWADMPYGTILTFYAKAPKKNGLSIKSGDTFGTVSISFVKDEG